MGDQLGPTILVIGEIRVYLLPLFCRFEPVFKRAEKTLSFTRSTQYDGKIKHEKQPYKTG